MGNALSRREVREQQRKKNARKWIALGGAGVILLAGGAVALTLVNNESENNSSAATAIPSSCTTTQRVTVETTEAMAGVLKQVPVDPNDCISLTVTSATAPADVAAQIISGKSAPNLWIPDSSTRAQLVLAGKGNLLTKAESLAKTPGVIVSQKDVSFKTWDAALADNTQVAMGDPKTDSAAFISMVNAAAESTTGSTTTEELTSSTALRAQTIGVDGPILKADQLLTQVNEGKADAAIVTEADYSNFVQNNSGTALKATVPSSGTGELDYPMYQLAATEANSTIDTASKKIQEFLKSEDGKQALSQQGFRNSDNLALSDISVGDVQPLVPTDPNVVVGLWKSYAFQSAPFNGLVALDVSGSMAYEIGDSGQTRMDVTKSSILAGSQLFPARDSIGLWIFSYDLQRDANNNLVDYKELVPIRGMEDKVDGKTQREILQSESDMIAPIPNSFTGLYDTTLAAFENMKENYKVGAANTVVVITDGENWDANSISREDLISTIQSQQDPDNPIYFLFIGVSQDAKVDDLKDLAAQIGGEAYPANSPSDVQQIFQNALAQTASQE